MTMILLLLAGLLAQSNPSSPSLTPQAIVQEITGSVTLQRAGKKTPLRLRTRLVEADVVGVEKQSAVVVTQIATGERYRYTEKSSFRVRLRAFQLLSGSPPVMLKSLDRRLLRGVRPDSAFSPQSAGVVVRGGGEAGLALLSPIGAVR